jgi:myo-inositol-1-phosphate synthase
VPWLDDRKWCYIRMEGTTFGNVPLNMELKLEVWDSPNSAGVVIDAVRCCKLGLDNGLSGTLEGPAAYFMKSPPVQHPDDLAHEMVETFIAEQAKAAAARRAQQDSSKGKSSHETAGADLHPVAPAANGH